MKYIILLLALMSLNVSAVELRIGAAASVNSYSCSQGCDVAHDRASSVGVRASAATRGKLFVGADAYISSGESAASISIGSRVGGGISLSAGVGIGLADDLDMKMLHAEVAKGIYFVRASVADVNGVVSWANSAADGSGVVIAPGDVTRTDVNFSRQSIMLGVSLPLN